MLLFLSQLDEAIKGFKVIVALVWLISLFLSHDWNHRKEDWDD